MQAADLHQGRWYTTGVPLPDGTVYAVNGADVDEVVSPGLEAPIQQAALFVPSVAADGSYTGGTWSDAGTAARKRTYHNTAMLLPDGSVLIGGNTPSRSCTRVSWTVRTCPAGLGRTIITTPPSRSTGRPTSTSPAR